MTLLAVKSREPGSPGNVHLADIDTYPVQPRKMLPACESLCVARIPVERLPNLLQLNPDDWNASGCRLQGCFSQMVGFNGSNF